MGCCIGKRKDVDIQSDVEVKSGVLGNNVGDKYESNSYKNDSLDFEKNHYFQQRRISYASIKNERRASTSSIKVEYKAKEDPQIPDILNESQIIIHSTDNQDQKSEEEFERVGWLAMVIIDYEFV